MADEKKKAPRVFKRLPPPEVIGLRKLKRVVDDTNEAFSDWAKERVEELGLYADQVNFETAIIRDPLGLPPGPREKDVRKVIDRLASETRLQRDREREVLKEAREKIKAISAASKAFTRRLEDVLLKYGIPAKSLDLNNGEITEDVKVITISEADGGDVAEVAPGLSLVDDEKANRSLEE